MTTGRYGKAVDHDALMETVADLAARGETLLGGGVSLDTIAEHSEFERSTLAKHCRKLADRGDLERRWGVGENGPQAAYLPADGGQDR
ncbi:hypothetical protein [Natrinema versiforme]|uniref:HTH iclR-type domain-containing protein n=1 Tax=Natrinema versiforme JCM 10478 TaxID=1227496 RepID=L9Y5D5_9EURY|nr:hypothetical protein [Natrinema versiforme]ELY68871.1 hypothetical protein C489_05878 [Natrinema versiforme JCM 10478]